MKHKTVSLTFLYDLYKMLKFVNTGIVFQEIPDEVTLAINISNCPCRCPGCHSHYLWENIGTSLTPVELENLVSGCNESVTCICFMGGDADPQYLCQLAYWLREHHPDLKIGWYSGRIRIPSNVDKCLFDYIKLGPYIKHLGGLKEPSTNQRLYKKENGKDFVDITFRFWEKIRGK